MDRRPSRLLFVVPSLTVGGAERHVTTLLPRMNKARFTPSLVCIGEEGEFFHELSAGGIEARALHLDGMRNALRALRELVKIMRGLRPDVVVLRGYNAEMLGRIAAPLAGVKHSIVWVRDMRDFAQRSSFQILTDRALVRFTSSYFGIAKAQIPYFVNELRCPLEKVRIIPNGVDPALFETSDDRGVLDEFGFAAGDPVVGTIARLQSVKDHVTLLRAARIIVNDLPRARFLIVGDGPTRADLETLCAELGISQNVHFAGTRTDIGRLLCAIDVFTLSSVTECFPMSLLEAMACARPAVCTDVGGVGEILEHGHSGYLVPARDPKQLAAQIKYLLTNKHIARRFGLAGRHRIESEFRLDRSVEAAERAIEDIVNGRAE